MVTLPLFTQPVSSCVWAPDGQSFITGHLDKKHSITQWNVRGKLLYDWDVKHRVQCLALAPDCSRLVAMNHDTTIYVHNYAARSLEYEIDIEGKVGSVTITANSRHLLVNKVDGEALIIDLNSGEKIQRFRAHTQLDPKFNIRATLGGANENFVVQGSEGTCFLDDFMNMLTISGGEIYIWHRENGQIIEMLPGHDKQPCNSVSWNPTNPQMFASAGDDGKVRMYVPLPPRKFNTNSTQMDN